MNIKWWNFKRKMRHGFMKLFGVYAYCVIVGVPDPTKDGGNMASALFANPRIGDYESDLYLENHSYSYTKDGKLEKRSRKLLPVTWKRMERIKQGMKHADELSFVRPVFELGEIVILWDKGGREVDGKQRKPSKWNVDVEEYFSLRKAIKRSQEVQQEVTDAILAKHGVS